MATGLMNQDNKQPEARNFTMAYFGISLVATGLAAVPLRQMLFNVDDIGFMGAPLSWACTMFVASPVSVFVAALLFWFRQRTLCGDKKST